MVTAARMARMKVVCFWVASFSRKGWRTRRATAKPAPLEATERKAVVGVGEPW